MTKHTFLPCQAFLNMGKAYTHFFHLQKCRLISIDVYYNGDKSGGAKVYNRYSERGQLPDIAFSEAYFHTEVAT